MCVLCIIVNIHGYFEMVINILFPKVKDVAKLIVSAHRRILGMASVVCVLVKICVSSISLYKL